MFARRIAGSYGLRMALMVELGNSDRPLPAQAGRENASGPVRGRRQRSSRTPGCNGQDRVKDGQGKLNNLPFAHIKSRSANLGGWRKSLG